MIMQYAEGGTAMSAVKRLANLASGAIAFALFLVCIYVALGLILRSIYPDLPWK